MNFKEYLAHRLIRTPLEGPAMQLRSLKGIPQRLKHPELKGIYQEGAAIDRVLKGFLQPQMNCIDIGVHLGSMLSFIYRHAPQGRHFAIEPIPYKCEWLRQKFPEAQLFEAALSDTPGEVDFYIDTKQSGFSGLQAGQHSSADTMTVLKVQCLRLDDIIPPDTSIDFIKIDVEGAELAALSGGTQLLDRCQPLILFECAKRSLNNHGKTPQEMYDFFQSRGYQIFIPQALATGQAALPYDRFTQALEYPFQAFNFFAQKYHG